MLVYRIRNLVTKKVYIGQTRFKAEARWNVHKKNAIGGDRSRLYSAIRKHGPEVFRVEVLYTAESPEELNAMETFFIVLHQSHRPENGYNMTLGGESGIPSDETRKRIAATQHLRMQNSRLRQRISRKLKGRRDSLSTREKKSRAHLGIPRSLQVRENISKFHKGKPPNNAGKPRSIESRKRSQEGARRAWEVRCGVA